VTEVSNVQLDTDVPLSVDTYADARASWRIVVLVSESVAARPEPAQHKPSVGCKAAGAKLPDVTLSVNGGAAQPGEVGTSSWIGYADDAAGDVIPTSVIHANVGDDLRLRIAGDVCASSWAITYGLDITEPQGAPGEVEPIWFFVPAQENPDGDLGFAAENRFLSAAREGDWIIKAGLGFPDGGGQFYWHVIVEP
jgi:hypothetical protein